MGLDVVASLVSVFRLHIDTDPVRNGTLDESGLGPLLVGERISDARGAARLIASGRPVVSPAGAASGFAQHHSELYQIARSEFLARLR
jgi:hypothetical protein